MALIDEDEEVTSRPERRRSSRNITLLRVAAAYAIAASSSGGSQQLGRTELNALVLDFTVSNFAETGHFGSAYIDYETGLQLSFVEPGSSGQAGSATIVED